MDDYTKYYASYQGSTLSQERVETLESLCRDLPDGNLLELGVGYGCTSLFLANRFPSRSVYCLDTFEGFAGLTEEFYENEENRWRKWGRAINYGDVIKQLSKHNNVSMIKGVFPDSVKYCKFGSLAFVHIDVDIYLSTKLGLEYFYDEVKPGGILLLDDIEFKTVNRAADEFCEQRNIKYIDQTGQRIIRK